MQFSKCFFFLVERKTEVFRGNPTDKKCKPHMALDKRTEPKEHWREALDTKDILEVHLAPKKQEFI